MTRLYREVPITSAEQAEALPIFTVARIDDCPATGYPEIARRIVGGWRNRDLVDGRIPHADMVGWTALVPIEAEEETHSVQTRGQARPEWRTRLVTPWEDA